MLMGSKSQLQFVSVVSGTSPLSLGLWPGEARRPGPALRSHRIPNPIAGHRGLKREHITLSQHKSGNRKTESAASRRSSQTSTISRVLIELL